MTPACEVRRPGVALSMFTLALGSALAGPAQSVTADDERRGDAAELSAVVVTATPETAPLTVVTDPKAPRQPVPASDGADLLKSIPGFSTIRKGGSNGDPMLRGMAGSRLNILVDGGMIAGGCPSRMDPPTAYIAPELFDRVTVIKGPQSVLWGAGSSAGTVLFERDAERRADTGWSLDGSLLGGSWGRADQAVDLRGGSPDVYASVTANHTRSDDYEDGNGDRVHSQWKRWNTDVAVGWTPDDDTRLELSAGKGDGEAAYAFSGMDGAQFLRESAGLLLEKRNPGSVLEEVEAKLYYNYADHVMDNYTLRDPDPDSMMPMPMASNVDRRTIGARVAGTLRWDAVSLTVGVDATRNVHSARMGGPPGAMSGYYGDKPRVRDARISNAGVFGESTWTLDGRRRLIAGLRFDRAQARGYTLEAGGMGGMEEPANVDATRSRTLPSGFVRFERDLDMPATFYAGIGHAARFPDYWELFGRHADTTLASFESLDPERTTQIDVGLRYGSGALRGWISAYAGRVDDFIVMHHGSGMMAQSHAANVDADIAGAEAGVQVAFGSNWKADASLAHAWGRNRTEHRPLPQMPPLEGRFSLTWDTGAWSLGALWRIAAKQTRYAVGEGNIIGQDLGPTGGFGVFSLNGGYRFTPNLALTAGIDNVFDKAYAEHVNAASAELAGYVNTVRVNEPGRTAWAKLVVRY